MKDQIAVEFEAGPSAAAGARNALLALDGKIDQDLLNDVRLLVSELVTNSVRHSKVRPDDRVYMTVRLTGNTLRVEVADRGDGFEPTPRTPDQNRIGGWGLYLVDQLADRWGVVRNNLTRVWFEVDHGRRDVRTAV
jgi:anti-sigma regulatory factor (Ser/Thr protein kinase)